MTKNAGVPAGNFSSWLQGTEAALRSGNGGADVPCGTCTACCRSSMFVHISPDETRTLQRIPRALLFPAPGRPPGHVLMGYDDRGHCPMLIDDRCSIYDDRPQTCRTYDCRVFAATAVPVDPHTQPDIAQRVSEWVFSYDTDDSRAEQATLRAAAAFLEAHRDAFPPGSLPSHPGQFPALAVRICGLFADMTAPGDDAPRAPDSAIIEAIRSLLTEPD